MILENNISDDHVIGSNANFVKDESSIQVTCGKYNLIVNHILSIMHNIYYLYINYIIFF